MKLRLLLFFTVVAILSMTGISYATEYKEYPLAPPGANIEPYEINNNGEVVACYYLPNNMCRYFVYNPITQVCSNSIDLDRGRVFGINDRGQVAMSILSTNAAGNLYYQGATWDSTNGDLTMIPSNGEYNTRVSAINNFGHVAGVLYPQGSPFFWDASGEMENLDFKGFAHAINDNDQILGEYQISNKEGYGDFIWSKETGMVDIGHYY